MSDFDFPPYLEEWQGSYAIQSVPFEKARHPCFDVVLLIGFSQEAPQAGAEQGLGRRFEILIAWGIRRISTVTHGIGRTARRSTFQAA
ncbi:hypothetical protein MA20_11445 [Bradyrhizobium japonicum]|uniref:Uncharacterized protein n=1 Tax=Bradyrhizobium japonicum TaxID=375 RepID=A0A0A3XYR6_BRAJP|nr:hypothetical protein MA20_11445 [Bradyrhizobium japonicum]